MKIRFIITVLTILSFFGVCFCQEKNQMLATYDFINKNDGTSKFIKLWINKSEAYSEFFNINKSRDTLYADEFENLYFKKDSNDSIGNQYYLSKNEIIFRDHIYTDNQFTSVIVTENLPKFNWILEENTVLFNGYACNKASLDFRGRMYNIWYTTEIPTQFGPWKFYGLPGLIIKVESVDKSIKFQLAKLIFVKDVELAIPSMGKKITFEEFVSYQEKITSDFLNKIKSKLPRGATIKVNKTESTNIEKNYD
jgi:GLPGLI family protein